jgi:hypothetical protein
VKDGSRRRRGCIDSNGKEEGFLLGSLVVRGSEMFEYVRELKDG